MARLVPILVMAEPVWVLQYSYRFNKLEIAEVIPKLLRSAELLMENSQIAAQAQRELRASRGDFADCLIDRCARPAPGDL